jgi:hypothetical protein
VAFAALPGADRGAGVVGAGVDGAEVLFVGASATRLAGGSEGVLSSSELELELSDEDEEEDDDLDDESDDDSDDDSDEDLDEDSDEESAEELELEDESLSLLELDSASSEAAGHFRALATSASITNPLLFFDLSGTAAYRRCIRHISPPIHSHRTHPHTLRKGRQRSTLTPLQKLGNRLSTRERTKIIPPLLFRHDTHTHTHTHTHIRIPSLTHSPAR